MIIELNWLFYIYSVSLCLQNSLCSYCVVCVFSIMYFNIILNGILSLIFV